MANAPSAKLSGFVMIEDTQWMHHALLLADRAEQEAEVPVGAVLVQDDEILAEAWNQPIGKNDATAHAEINAIRLASQKIGNYRLPNNTTLYVTLETCTMCAGAIIHARIARVVFAAYDAKSGAAGSAFDILGTDKLNHKVDVLGGVLEELAAEKLRSFFRQRR